ncbi:MAG: DUF5107 domain-containing protein, partial [Bacteroidaceae bacterium]|nr:DUF5107 domain-containing protein [Bacteroidaceae bacterium]
MHGEVCNYHELALDYAQARLFDEAVQVLTIPSVAEQLAQASPLTSYYLGYFMQGQGLIDEANAYFVRAEHTAPGCCFPNRLEDVQVLTIARNTLDHAARAPYYLGCLYYDKRQYDLAKRYWELSAQRDPSYPTVWRNLALYYYNKEHDSHKAQEYMEQAFQLDENDSRVFMELDQLYKRMQRPHTERLKRFETYAHLVVQRDDLILEQATLLNQTGYYDRAAALIDSHIFHPWEGGEGKVPTQYHYARVEQAKALLHSAMVSGNKTDIQHAIRLLSECLHYPHHLGEGKLQGAQDNDFHYYLGLAYELLGEDDKARKHWQLGIVGPTDPAAAMYYNDAKPDKIFYAALCYRQLGNEERAKGLFHKLINYGKQHIFDVVTMDYFAVSLPDLLVWDADLNQKNRIHCLYMLALGYAGMGEREQAMHYLDEAAQLDINHDGINSTYSFLTKL